MYLSGLEKFSLIDYPGKIAAVVFTQGCNFRCSFCYNPMLIGPPVTGVSSKEKNHPYFSEDGFFSFLKTRQGKLDGIVISGGEPTSQDDLLDFILKIKKLNFSVKLDTNGSRPEVLASLLDKKVLDYIAMDIKGPRDKYREIISVEIDFNKILESINLIMKSRINYEFRSTLVPAILGKSDIAQMGELIQGTERWYLQNFKSNAELLNKNLEGSRSFSDEEMSEMREIGARYVRRCEIR